MSVTRLLASDFPSENPRLQNRTILINTLAATQKNQTKNYGLGFIFD